MKFWSHGKGGLQASDFGQMVRGKTGMKFWSHGKGDCRHEILVTW